jgi:hypothetical protein
LAGFAKNPSGEGKDRIYRMDRIFRIELTILSLPIQQILLILSNSPLSRED